MAPAHDQPNVQLRFETLSRRLDRLQKIWIDQDAIKNVIESGRYLKLVNTTTQVQEALDKALLHVQAEHRQRCKR